MGRYSRIHGIDERLFLWLGVLYGTAEAVDIAAGNTGIERNLVDRVIGAGAVVALCTPIAGIDRHIAAPRPKILIITTTIKMRFSRERCGDAEDNCKRHDRPFDLFHTNVFVFLVKEIDDI